MDTAKLTCDLVDERDLVERYVTSRLTGREAEAFEAHYFECDRCWSLVRAGTGVQSAAEAERGGATRSASSPSAVRRPSRWRPLAIAAGLAGLAVVSWQVLAPGRAGEPDVVRGMADSVGVRSAAVPGGWQADWTRLSGAAVYRLRVFDGEGRLLLDREVTDTSAAVTADSLSGVAADADRYLEVQALDSLRRPLARSPLTRLRALADSS